MMRAYSSGVVILTTCRDLHLFVAVCKRCIVSITSITVSSFKGVPSGRLLRFPMVTNLVS